MMTREQAMAKVLAVLPEKTAVVAANGHISRALFALGDRPEFFYMIGSMGLASSIALGIAKVLPTRQVAVFDGDGNVLMALGTLASVASQKPQNFVHCCFDNGEYGSTGGQRSISGQVSLGAIAASCGYTWAAQVDNENGLEQALAGLFERQGPSFLLIKVLPGGLPKGTGRVTLTPEQMTARMRDALSA